MDVSKIINTEKLHTMELLHPITEEELGVTFKIRSSNSDEAKAVQRKHIDEIYERTRSGKGMIAKETLKLEIEKAAYYVADWDWGKNKYEGSVPKFSPDKVIEVLEKQSWILAQVTGAANNLANFTQDLPQT